MVNMAVLVWGLSITIWAGMMTTLGYSAWWWSEMKRKGREQGLSNEEMLQQWMGQSVVGMTPLPMDHQQQQLPAKQQQQQQQQSESSQPAEPSQQHWSDRWRQAAAGRG
jgi:hypothetical protein